MTRAERLAEKIRLYWAKQGFVVQVVADGDAIVSSLIDGMPRGYTGPDNARSSVIEREPIAPDHRKPNLRLVA